MTEARKAICVATTINNIEYFGEVPYNEYGYPERNALEALAKEAVAYHGLTTPWNRPASVGLFLARLYCRGGILRRARLGQINVSLPHAPMTEGEYVDAKEVLYADLSSSQIQAIEEGLRVASNGLEFGYEGRYAHLKNTIKRVQSETDRAAKPREALLPLPTGYFRTTTPLTFVDKVGNEELVAAGHIAIVTGVERLPVRDDPEDDGIRYTLALCDAVDTTADCVPPEAVEPDFSVPDWTYEDSLRASAEGWDIFSGTPERDHHIERIDEVAKFEADKDAERHVWKQACAGNQLCRRAMSFLAHHNPAGYTSLKNRLGRDA